MSASLLRALSKSDKIWCSCQEHEVLLHGEAADEQVVLRDEAGYSCHALRCHLDPVGVAFSGNLWGKKASTVKYD